MGNRQSDSKQTNKLDSNLTNKSQKVAGGDTGHGGAPRLVSPTNRNMVNENLIFRQPLSKQTNKAKFALGLLNEFINYYGRKINTIRKSKS